MDRADFLKLFAYSDNCWRVLGETLAVVPDAWEMPFPTTSNWNTIRLLQAHCIGAEERWITLRLQNQPLPIVYEERAASDWAGLYQDHLTIRAATRAYLDSLADAEVEAETPVLPANEHRDALTRADVLFHILNHENYHRGQSISVLQRLGADPPNFDYIFLKA